MQSRDILASPHVIVNMYRAYNSFIRSYYMAPLRENCSDFRGTCVCMQCLATSFLSPTEKRYL